MCKRLMFFISLAVLLGPVADVSAATITWTNAYPWSLLWSTAENWDPPVVPGPFDEAYINPPPEQGPIIDSNIIVGDIRGPGFDSNSNQTMYVMGGTVVVNGSWEFGDNGSGTSIIYIYDDPDVTVNGQIRHREGNAEIYIDGSANVTANYQMQLADFGSAVLDISGEPVVVIAGDLRGADSNSGWFEAYISSGSLFVGGALNIGEDGSGIIDINGGAVDCNVLRLQMHPEASTGTLNVSGGSIYIEESLQINDGNGTATMNMSGGDVNTAELRLAGGSGSAALNMTGGSLVVSGSFSSPAEPNGTAAIDLNGGTIECGWFTHAAAYAMDIEEGVLVIDGNVSDAVLADVNAGYITGYDTLGYVVVDFNNFNPGRTTVQAVPYPDLIPVPDVVGMTQSAAETAITGVGLKVGDVAGQYSDVVPVGDVISQDPPAGTVVSVGSFVDLVVSLGQPDVPDVVGMTEADANSAITAAALIIGTIVYEYNDTVAADFVISQDPVGGTTVPVGTSVDLVVSLGQPVVPNVFGMIQPMAIAAIEAVDNLTVGAVIPRYDNAVPAGFILGQDPPAGTVVPIGSTVDLVVSVGRPVVPDVVGMTEPNATAAIEAIDNLTVGTVIPQYSNIIPAGIVIGQTPPAGKVVLVGTAVTLVVSLGQPVVPDVVGQAEANAVAAIEAVDNLVAAVSRQYHNSMPAGDVIAQNPVGGTTVNVGATVNIVVSLGRPVVPDVVGMHWGEAWGVIIAVDDLWVDTPAFAYSDIMPVDYVISQNPVGGAEVLVGSGVELLISLGQPIVPGVVGQAEADAVAAIEAVDNLEAAITYEYHNTIPSGNVISQNPVVGTAVPVGSTVDLVVSLGWPEVPDVVGMHVDDAVAAITAVDNLYVREITFEYSNTVPVDHVTGQNPGGHTLVEVGMWVDLIVSLGKPVVPDVVGWAEANAVVAIEAVDDLTATVSRQYHNTVPAGNVIAENPVAGTLVPIGSSVELVVSLGQPVVPDVVGMTEPNATAAITAVDNLTVGTLTYDYSDTVPKDYVTAQSPVGGTAVPIGSSVSLELSLGQPVVPDVVGMYGGDAVEAIEAVDHLFVSAIIPGYSNTVPLDHVISQSPSGGTVVPIGSGVDLVVSIGPVIVPDVVGLPEADAVAAIEAVDDLTATVSRQYHNTVPAGVVIAQNPIAGTLVPIGSSVELVVSLGQPVVPNVVGMHADDAAAAITAVDDLQVDDTITFAYSDTLPKDYVTAQSPVGGTAVPIGSSVSLELSLGQPVVPDVVGMYGGDAVEAIEAVDHLQVDVIIPGYSNTVPVDYVISQDPSGGTVVPIGSGVELVLSIGPVIVPDVVGLPEADAVAAIEVVDSLTTSASYEYHNSVPAGYVISQNPVGGAAVDIGTTVSIVVSLGRPIVPTVVGWVVADAIAAIEAIDNLTAATAYEYHNEVPAGSVISQNPVGGSVVNVGTVVNVVVSLGRFPLMVLGGNRLVGLQNNDGGWDRPLDDGEPNSGSDPETFASVAMGLSRAYRRNRQTADPNMPAALQKAKTFLLSKTDNFTVTDGALAVELDGILGGTACVDYVNTNFYDKLAAGTYYDARSDAVHNMTSYIWSLRVRRFNEGIANLAAWDLGLGLYSAYMIGAGITEWVAGVEAEIDELDGSHGYDVLGLAGAVFGLAAAGEDYDPQAGQHEAASSLGDLAAILAGYQLGTGGFTWHWLYMEEGLDETVQETVYALIALNEFDRAGYLTEIGEAGNYLQSIQLVTGGWENYPGYGEKNEITGEVLRAMAASQPAVGDFDKDGDVDLKDFAIFASAWLTEYGDAEWNPDCDISIPVDDSVNMLDLVVFTDNWLTGVIK